MAAPTMAPAAAPAQLTLLSNGRLLPLLSHSTLCQPGLDQSATGGQVTGVQRDFYLEVLV